MSEIDLNGNIINNQFKDEILVQYEGLGLGKGGEALGTQYTVTSHAHREGMSLIKAGVTSDAITGRGILFTDEDLQAFKKLGYAVCNNMLDCHGGKVYIHHNARTFKESKKK
jgi:hypothetical protein